MPIDYEQQAATFDETRAASPTVCALLLDRLGPGRDEDGRPRSLVDVAGGTGNYAAVVADAGFSVTVVDGARAMATRAAAKLRAWGGRAIVGDAAALPFADAAFEAGIVVSALHQFPDQPRALAAARRVLGGGPFVLQAFTRENTRPLFVFDYFDASAPPEDMHAPAETIAGWLRVAGFGEVEWTTYAYDGLEDGSLAALHTDPALLASPGALGNTSFFHRLDDAARAEGLRRLGRDLAEGRLADRVAESRALAAEVGHGTVFVGST